MPYKRVCLGSVCAIARFYCIWHVQQKKNIYYICTRGKNCMIVGWWKGTDFFRSCASRKDRWEIGERLVCDIFKLREIRLKLTNFLQCLWGWYWIERSVWSLVGILVNGSSMALNVDFISAFVLPVWFSLNSCKILSLSFTIWLTVPRRMSKRFAASICFFPPARKLMISTFFLVADTQLYKRLCPSVRPSVRGHWVEKWENAHFHPCPPVRNWYWPCIRCSAQSSLEFFMLHSLSTSSTSRFFFFFFHG